jgi:uncharacterized protein (UPF0548 family)
MTKPLHRHAALITALGGPTKLAAWLKLNVVHTVGKWSRRGIPARYWPDVIALADTNRIAGITYGTLRGANETTDPGTPSAP